MELPEAFARLIQYDSKEKINIVTNRNVYPINKSLGVAISPLFFQAIKENPTLKEVFVPIDENITEFFEKKINR